jgi:hypothetical protein
MRPNEQGDRNVIRRRTTSQQRSRTSSTPTKKTTAKPSWKLQTGNLVAGDAGNAVTL